MFCDFKMSRIRIRNPVYGSKDPDLSQNVTDPEHCREGFTLYERYPTTNPYLCGSYTGNYEAF